MSLFNELKRRNVFRVAIAYLVIAWLLAQVADLAFDNFGTPEGVSKTVLFLLLLGFPLAVFFAWAFEITPEGVKKEKDIDRSASITTHTGRKLDYSIIVLLVIALGYFVWESRVSDRVPVTASADASIAVLAFENMSPDPENAFFCRRHFRRDSKRIGVGRRPASGLTYLRVLVRQYQHTNSRDRRATRCRASAKACN